MGIGRWNGIPRRATDPHIGGRSGTETSILGLGNRRYGTTPVRCRSTQQVPGRRIDVPVLAHIVPVMVRDPVLCKRIGDTLVERDAIYLQPISYPTVARGTERLRFIPIPCTAMKTSNT